MIPPEIDDAIFKLAMDLITDAVTFRISQSELDNNKFQVQRNKELYRISNKSYQQANNQKYQQANNQKYHQ
jgi:hypothetical protein